MGTMFAGSRPGPLCAAVAHHSKFGAALDAVFTAAGIDVVKIRLWAPPERSESRA
jgi:hypothetical protein